MNYENFFYRGSTSHSTILCSTFDAGCADEEIIVNKPQSQRSQHKGRSDSDQICNKCGKNGHFARFCKAELSTLKCYRCEGNGHIKRFCKTPIKCLKCHQEGHIQSKCPIENNDPQIIPPTSNFRKTTVSNAALATTTSTIDTSTNSK